MTALEIAVQDAVGARIAFTAGADRVELCQALSATGGLTPSAGAVDAVLAESDAPHRVAVLVRPRAGGFVYAAEEVAVVAADVADVRRRGVGAVVVGALTRDGRVDRSALDAWRSAAQGIDLVFHRAIDTLADPRSAIGDLVECGVTRVLTSGGAKRSLDGADVLAGMVDEAAGRLEVMAGGGVGVDDIPALLALRVHAIHLSAKRFSHDDAPGGPGGGSAAGYDVTDADIVGRAVQAVRGGR